MDSNDAASHPSVTVLEATVARQALELDALPRDRVCEQEFVQPSIVGEDASHRLRAGPGDADVVDTDAPISAGRAPAGLEWSATVIAALSRRFHSIQPRVAIDRPGGQLILRCDFAHDRLTRAHAFSRTARTRVRVGATACQGWLISGRATPCILSRMKLILLSPPLSSR